MSLLLLNKAGAKLSRRLKLISLVLFVLSCHLSPASVHADINRPAASTGPTVVTTDIYILDVDGVDTSNQSFDANVFVELSWQDDRLKHTQKGAIVKKSGEIWAPRVQVVNLQRS